MFEELFTDGSTIERYRVASLLCERLRWFGHRADSGVRRTTLRTIAVHQIHLVRLLGLQAGDRVGIVRVEAAAERWCDRAGAAAPQSTEPDARQKFVGRATRWLRFAGMFEEASCCSRHAHAGEVAAFARWMRTERGWSEQTVRVCCNAADDFLDRLDARGIALRSVRMDDIDGQIASWQARGLSWGSLRCNAQRLRTFFRFAEDQAWSMAGLADGITPPRFLPGETPPRGLGREEFVRLLATTEGERPVDRRDRAMLMLLITYGLRLDDIDWAEERLQVRCPKPGRTHLDPPSHGVGQTVLRYVREVRPPRPERALFLTLSAPIRPITVSTIGSVVHRRANRIGIAAGRRRGPHALRHGTGQRPS